MHYKLVPSFLYLVALETGPLVVAGGLIRLDSSQIVPGLADPALCSVRLLVGVCFVSVAPASLPVTTITAPDIM